MSAIVQRLQLIWTSNSAQARGDIGLASGQVLQLGRNVQQSGRQAGAASAQMRAFGTTLRYMVAGSVIYGIGSMVRNLAQLQQSMGLISAIGTTAGFTDLSRTGGGIQQLTVDMLNLSTRTVQPMDEVSSAMENLVSSVQATQGIGTKDLVPALEVISKAAKLSVTPVQDMTKGITSMNQAFGRPQSLSNITHLAAQWYEMIALVPGGKAAAPQLIGQLGNIAGMARAAHVTPGQMFALTSSQLRFGIPPSQAGAGLAYLFRTISQPQSGGTVKSARAAFASLGITGESVQQQGGLNTLVKIAQAVEKEGLHGNFKRAASLAFANRDDPNYDPNSVAGLGISGEGLGLAGDIFRRQHALRAFIAFYSFWKMGTFDSDLRRLGDSQAAYKKSLGDFADGWENFIAQVPLSQAATALQNLKTEMVMGFGPFLKYPAKAITGLSGFAGRHPDATRYAAQAGAGLITALGGAAVLSRIPGLKNIPGLGKIGGLFGGISGAAGQGLVTTQAIQDTMKALEDPNAPLGSSPTKPLYVYVIGQAPWVASGNSTVPLPKDLKGGIEQDAIKVEKAAKRFGPWIGLAAQRLGGARFLGKAGMVGAGLFSFSALRHAWESKGPEETLFPVGDGSMRHRRYTFRAGKFTLQGDSPDILHGIPGRTRTEKEMAVAAMLHTTPRNIHKLERAFGGKSDQDISKILKDNNDRLVASIAQGAAGFTLDLTVVDDKGKATARKRVHVPPDTFSGGKAPGARGGKKVMKITGAMKNV